MGNIQITPEEVKKDEHCETCTNKSTYGVIYHTVFGVPTQHITLTLRLCETCIESFNESASEAIERAAYIKYRIKYRHKKREE